MKRAPYIATLFLALLVFASCSLSTPTEYLWIGEIKAINSAWSGDWSCINIEFDDAIVDIELPDDGWQEDGSFTWSLIGVASGETTLTVQFMSDSDVIRHEENIHVWVLEPDETSTEAVEPSTTEPYSNTLTVSVGQSLSLESAVAPEWDRISVERDTNIVDIKLPDDGWQDDESYHWTLFGIAPGETIVTLYYYEESSETPIFTENILVIVSEDTEHTTEQTTTTTTAKVTTTKVETTTTTVKATTASTTKATTTAKVTTATTTTVTTTQAETVPALALPGNDSVKKEPGGSVELTIKAPAGSVSTFVRIYDSNGNVVAHVFLRPSGSGQVHLSSGTYTIKVGYGETWYGEKELFGESGQYSQCLNGSSETFVFESDYNYTLKLLASTSGNVGSKRISPKDM